MSIEDTLNERQHQHGDFQENAEIAQDLKNVLRSTEGWHESLNAVQRQALEAICDKISRILAGDPNHRDHWHDIGGYSRLVEKSLMSGL